MPRVGHRPRNPSHAWYALRRTLPTWSFEDNLRELVRCLPKYGVDELIVKVDTEEFTHGQPPLDWVTAYQESLFRVKKAMEKLGIVYSINPWITVGHCDRGRDDRRKLPGLRTVVGHDGTECTCCACPLSTVWRDHIAKVWTLYAETMPHIIWVEDDIRTFNHSPVSFGCFCPDHMRLLSQRVGREMSREELVSAMLRPGEPHPWRAQYLDMQAEVMIDTVSFLGKVVHRTSPETCLGLMSSGPHVHCLEGRRWREFALAMADGTAIYSRPPMGNYSEDSMRGFYYSHDSIKITRFCMPAGTIEQTEVENVPFTGYSKSNTFTFLEMAVSFAYGSHGVTMNLFDHAGTPMADDAGVGRMLGDRKPYLNGLAARCREPGSYRGVRLLHHERSSYHKRMPEGASYWHLMEDGDAGMRQLESVGIPTTYDDAIVVNAVGQTLRAFSDEEIRGMLGRGLLLDAPAAITLCERGFGEDIGLESIAKPEHLDRLGAFSAEEFFDARFGGADRKYLTLTVPHLGGRPWFSVMEPAEEAKVISRIVDPDAVRHHVCMYAYENRRGGRVVVQAFDLGATLGTSYFHPFRLEQLQAAVGWLARGQSPIMVRGGVYPLAFRKDIEGRSILGLFNLTLDPWPFVEFDLYDARRVDGAEALGLNGAWRRSSALSAKRSMGRWSVRYAREVRHDQPLLVTIYWK